MHAFHNNEVLRLIASRYLHSRLELLAHEMSPGSAEDTHSWQARRLSIDEAFDYIRPEFGGMPLICFEVAKRIVLLRRQTDVVPAWYFFRAALDDQHAVIMKYFTSRWIISALDTVVDFASPGEAARAEALKDFFLGVRYGYSMLFQRAGLAQTNPRLDNEDLDRAQNIWDGINQFNYRGGDTYGNLVLRLNRTLRGYPYLESAARQLHARIARHPVLGVPYQVNRPLRTSLGLPETRDQKEKRRKTLPPSSPDPASGSG